MFVFLFYKRNFNSWPLQKKKRGSALAGGGVGGVVECFLFLHSPNACVFMRVCWWARNCISAKCIGVSMRKRKKKLSGRIINTHAHIHICIYLRLGDSLGVFHFSFFITNWRKCYLSSCPSSSCGGFACAIVLKQSYTFCTSLHSD